MRNILLLFGILIISQIGLSQPPDLANFDWYIDHVVLDGITYESPIEPSSGILNPNIDFYPGKVYAVIDPESDSFFGLIDYDPQDQRFTITEPAITLPGCQIYCDFANVYFELLFGDGIEIVFDWVLIVTDEGDKWLMIERTDGSYAFYNDHPPLGIDDQQRVEIKMAPNPVIEVLHISSEDIVVEEIYIYDLSGKPYSVVWQDRSSLDVSSLSQGIYFLELNTNVGRAVHKFIKK